MTSVMPAKARQALVNTMEFPKRLGVPEEFASTVVHMIQQTYMNGNVVRLDGAVRLGKL
jgi:NAD(P)-dependent dehydrogenase (short-subunit alcohol dehydrogenase family)